MQIHTLQHNDIIYSIGDCVQHSTNQQPELAIITAFSIQNNVCTVHGSRVAQRSQYTNIQTYNKILLRLVAKAKLPQQQECFLTSTNTQFLLSDVSHKIQLVSLAYYTCNKMILQQDPHIYYWTHYITPNNKLCRKVYNTASEFSTPLMRALSPPSIAHGALLKTYTNNFIALIQANMHKGKGYRRISRFVQPFCIEAYHNLFDGVGEQLPPSVVSTAMKFCTYIYFEDLGKLDTKLSQTWREKHSSTTQQKRKRKQQQQEEDTFLRVTSIRQADKFMTVEPVAEDPNSKKRKRTMRMKSALGDVLFTVQFDLSTNLLSCKFCYHKYWTAEIDSDCPLYIW